MKAYELNDAQWLVLDLLIRSRAQGVMRLNRMELLTAEALPQGARLKLAFAALTIPAELVVWTGPHDFAITEAGISLFNLRFGKGAEPAVPTRVADAVIYLPGPEAYCQ